MAIRDFRETSFNLKGTWDSPEMLDLKVSRGSAPLTIPRSNGSTGKNETQIKITVEIPTGSGSDTSASTEEQVKKQLLENIMKSIIKPGSTEND
jgi:translocation and assembly module TamB